MSSAQDRLTAPTPDAKLMRLKRLNISARNCKDTRSLMAMFLMTETSTSLKLGPTNLLRETGAPAHPGSLGLQNAEGLSHCTPGNAELKLCETPENGSPMRFSPDRTSSYGWPE